MSCVHFVSKACKTMRVPPWHYQHTINMLGMWVSGALRRDVRKPVAVDGGGERPPGIALSVPSPPPEIVRATPHAVALRLHAKRAQEFRRCVVKTALRHIRVNVPFAPQKRPMSRRYSPSKVCASYSGYRRMKETSALLDEGVDTGFADFESTR
jgi:hypothetical protein